jgi:tetratricopeptide (TPR) repeat protein
MEILTLGEKIKHKRKELEMTLKELAGDKVTPGQISLVESGKSKPSIDLLEYIAERLNVSIDYILETEEHQAEKLCEYYARITDASLLAGNFEQAREAINKGMTYAQNYKLEYYIGLNEFYMGKNEYLQNNYESSQSRFISANEISFKIGKITNVIDTYMYLGMVTYKLLYFNSALNFYKQAEKIINENKIINEEVLMRIYFNISLCYTRLDNYSATIDYALLAMEKFRLRNDRSQYGQSLLMLSISYNSLNKYDEALAYADKAVSVFRELDNLTFIAKMETNIGIILSDIGNMDESFKHLEKAYGIKQEINDKTLTYTMLRLADNYIKAGDKVKAMEIISDAYERCIDDVHSEDRLTIYCYLHRLNFENKDYKKAELYLLEAVKYLQNLDMPKELADIYIMLGKYYESMENQSEALRYMDNGLEIYKKLGIISI